MWLLSDKWRHTMILILAWAAGSLDAIGYLGLGHVFTANMTGNTVLLGLALGQGQGVAALRSVVALGGFALGVATGATIMSKDRERMDWPPSVTTALFLEGIVLAIFSVAWHALSVPQWLYALIALSAVAMGIQSAAVRRLRVPGIATTYITGTLTSFVTGVTSRIRQAGAASPLGGSGGEPVTASSPEMNWERRVGLQAGVFMTYVLAAVLSGFAQTRAPSLATISPVVAVVVVAITAWAHGRRGEPAPS
jgi:uncharacterized membrane protein YoaK (UPF0700 family)